MERQTPTLGGRADADQFVPFFSWAEYLALDTPTGMRIEFESGRLLVSPSRNTAHDLLIAVLLEFLGSYESATENRLCVAFAPHSFFMPPEERDYQPDVGIITDHRKDRPLENRITGAPNIAVEVLSPSTQRRDRGIKAEKYFEQGTAEYWLFEADPLTAEFHRRGEQGWVRVEPAASTYDTTLLPGFVLDLVAVARRLDQKLRRTK